MDYINFLREKIRKAMETERKLLSDLSAIRADEIQTLYKRKF